MSFATIMSSAVTIWQIHHAKKLPVQKPSVAVENLTLESIKQDSNQNLLDQTQTQLVLDAISRLSSQIAVLSEQLGSCDGNTGSSPVRVQQGDFRQHTPTRGLDDNNSRWIWLFNVVSMALWLVGAGICVYGLRKWPARDVTRFLTWGLSAGSFGLSVALFWRHVDSEWVYVMITAMPAYVAMTIALSVIGGDVEEEKQA